MKMNEYELNTLDVFPTAKFLLRIARHPSGPAATQARHPLDTNSSTFERSPIINGQMTTYYCLIVSNFDTAYILKFPLSTFLPLTGPVDTGSV